MLVHLLNSFKSSFCWYPLNHGHASSFDVETKGFEINNNQFWQNWRMRQLLNCWINLKRARCTPEQLRRMSGCDWSSVSRIFDQHSKLVWRMITCWMMRLGSRMSFKDYRSSEERETNMCLWILWEQFEVENRSSIICNRGAVNYSVKIFKLLVFLQTSMLEYSAN